MHASCIKYILRYMFCVVVVNYFIMLFVIGVGTGGWEAGGATAPLPQYFAMY